jgi:hypothetical protein
MGGAASRVIPHGPGLAGHVWPRSMLAGGPFVPTAPGKSGGSRHREADVRLILAAMGVQVPGLISASVVGP